MTSKQNCSSCGCSVFIGSWFSKTWAMALARLKYHTESSNRQWPTVPILGAFRKSGWFFGWSQKTMGFNTKMIYIYIYIYNMVILIIFFWMIWGYPQIIVKPPYVPTKQRKRTSHPSAASASWQLPSDSIRFQCAPFLGERLKLRSIWAVYVVHPIINHPQRDPKWSQ